MPYLPESRQYRNFAASNFQPVQRDDGSDEPSYVVEGHFTVFDAPYELVPGFFETIDRHALDKTDMSDVLFQFNHSGMVLARLRNHSLQVGVDNVGGWSRADLSGCQQARDLYEAISNGLIDRMSFGFTIAPDGVEYDEDDEGNIHSRITNIDKLFDVSPVDLPASEHTDISARSYAEAIIEARSKRAEQESQAGEPEVAEHRSAEQPEQVMAEVEAFDVDSIVEQVIERMAKRDAQESPEVPEDPEEPEVSPEDAEQALEDVERGTQAERRRRRRMRALRMLDI